MYLVGRRFYKAIVAGDARTYDEAQAASFLSSFRLLPRPPSSHPRRASSTEDDWFREYVSKSEQLWSSDLAATDYGRFIHTAFAQLDDAMVEKLRTPSRTGVVAIVERATTFVGERLRAASALQGRAKQEFAEGPFDIDHPSLDALNTQLELARQWSLASKLKRDVVESSVELFRRVLEAGPYPASIEPVVEAYEYGLQMDLLLKMNDADKVACQAIIDCQSLLKEHWGRWQITPSGVITLDDDLDGQLARQYGESVAAMVEAGMQVQIMGQLYLSRAKEMAGSAPDPD